MCCPAGIAVATDLDRAADPAMFRMRPRLLMSVALPDWIGNYPNRVVECQAATVEYLVAVVPARYSSERVQPKVFLRR